MALLEGRAEPDARRQGIWFITTCGNPLCSCRDATVNIYSTDDRLMCVDVLEDGIRQSSMALEPIDISASGPDRESSQASYRARVAQQDQGGDDSHREL